MLVIGMVRIVKVDVEGIIENCFCFAKRDSMVCQIRRCFLLIPLAFHSTSIALDFFGLARVGRHRCLCRYDTEQTT